MAVQSVTPGSAGASGSASGTDPANVSVTYTSNYNVQAEPGDTCDLVLLHFSQHADLPWMGRVFNFGNGFDSSVTTKTVNADYIDKSAGKFTVRCTFESQNNGGQGGQTSGKDSKGKETLDPLKWYPQIEISSSVITEAADRAIFRGLVNSTFTPFPKDSDRAITNSAGIPYDPPIERENRIRVIRITRNYKEWPGPDFYKYEGKVNSDTFTIKVPEFGYRSEYRPYYAMFTSFSESNVVENGKAFWRGTTEIQIHPRTWRRQILDMGTYRSQATGDKTDGGVELNDNQTLVDGFVPFVSVKGADGLPVSHPVPFNGNGQPLKSKTQPNVYLVYSVDTEVPFAGIKW